MIDVDLEFAETQQLIDELHRRHCTSVFVAEKLHPTDASRTTAGIASHGSLYGCIGLLQAALDDLRALAQG